MDPGVDLGMDLGLIHHGRCRGQQRSARSAPAALRELWNSVHDGPDDTSELAVSWLLVLCAFCEDDAALAAELHGALTVGQYTNFFFHADGLVGLAVPDNKTLHLVVDKFMPSYKLRIVFNEELASVERLGFTQFVAFVANSSTPLRWWGGLDVSPVVVGPAIRAAFAVPELSAFRGSSVL
jgi:hypothetical protein